MLTEKQQRFCKEYIADGDATQAAIRAGYTRSSAGEQASRLLANVAVVDHIETLMQQQATVAPVTTEFVLQGLKEVAQRCLQQQPVMVWDSAAGMMVQQTDDDCNGVWEFDSSGANRALELLGRHLGIFEKDNSQKGKVIIVNIV